MKTLFVFASTLIAVTCMIISCQHEHPCPDNPAVLSHDSIRYVSNYISNPNNDPWSDTLKINYKNLNAPNAQFRIFEVMTDGSEVLLTSVSAPVTGESIDNLTLYFQTTNQYYVLKIYGYAEYGKTLCASPFIYQICPPNPIVLGSAHVVLGQINNNFITDFDITYRNVTRYNSNDPLRASKFILYEVMPDGSEEYRATEYAFPTGEETSYGLTNFFHIPMSRPDFKAKLYGYFYYPGICDPSVYSINNTP